MTRGARPAGCGAAGRWLIAAVVGIAGCQFNAALPDEALIACEADDDCPVDWICNAGSGRCEIFGGASDSPPVISLLPVNPAGLRYQREVSVLFTLNDLDGETRDETVSLSFEITTGDPDHPDTLWTAATTHTGSDPIVDIAVPEGTTTGTYRWDAFADAGAGAPGMSLATVNQAGGLGSIEVVAFLPQVSLRAAALDAGGLAGASGVLTFALGNDAPVVELGLLDSNGRGAVPFGIQVSDSAADTAQLVIEFRLAEESIWRTAAAAFPGIGSEPIVPTSPEGLTHIFVWDSAAALDDDATRPQGVGLQIVEVDLRARAADQVDGTLHHYGPWSETAVPITIVNQSTPRVTSVAAVRRPDLAGSAPVVIQYTAVDEESDLVDLQIDYALEDGSGWTPCNEHRRPSSEGRYELTTAPTGVGAVGGLRHTFVWDTTGLTLGPAQARLRLSVADGYGPPSPFAELLLVAPVGDPATPSPFASEVRYPVGWQPTGMTVGEFNGDGIDDLAVAVYSGSFIIILLGNGSNGVGDGTFTAGNQYDVFWNPNAIAPGDFDSDGITDLAVAASGSDDVNIYLGGGTGGVGDGTFVLTYAYDLRIAADDPDPVYLEAVDLDDDGILDLAAGNIWAKRVSLLYGSGPSGMGDGTFEEAVSLDTDGLIWDFVLTDLDADGDVDIAVAAFSSLLPDPFVQVFDNLGGRTFALPLTYEPEVKPDYINAAEINGDGVVDLIVASYWENELGFLYGEAPGGTPNGEFVVSPITLPVLSPVDILVADLNRDGIEDLGLPTEPGEVAVFMGAGVGAQATGDFAPPLFLPAGDLPLEGHFSDFDDDGWPDIAVVNSGSDDVSVLRLDPRAGVAVLNFAGVESFDASSMPSDLVSADLDADGLLDFIISDDFSDELVILPGAGVPPLGEGSFGAATAVALSTGPDKLNIGDLNGDGIPDLVVSPAGWAPITIFLGNDAGGFGDGDFATPVELITGEVPDDVALGDLDGDGHLDLVMVANSVDLLEVYLGHGDGSFSMGDTYAIGDHPMAVAIADLDVDGAVDLVVANRFGDTVSVLLGELAAGSPTGTFGTATVRGDGHPRDWAVTTDPQYLAVTDIDADGVLDLLVASQYAETISLLLGQTAGGLPNATFDDVDPRADGQPRDWPMGGACRQLVLGDLNQDGTPDLGAINRDTYTVSVLLGERAGGILGAPIPSPVLSNPSRLIAADINRDGLLDLATTTLATNGVSVLLQERARPWERRRVVLLPATTSAVAGSLALGSELVPATLDRFGGARRAPALSRRRVTGIGPYEDFNRVLRAGGLVAGAIPPVTDAWLLAGDLALVRVDAGALGDEAGPRFQVVSRFGTRTAPGSRTDLQRRGLDLSPAALADQRGVLVEIPILSQRSAAELAGPSAVRLFRHRLDWLRAAGVTADPFSGAPEADGFLPRVPVAGEPDRFRDVFAERYQLDEIPLDADGDLDTGGGSRFVVDVSDPANRRLRVLTDRLGIFGAVLVTP